MNHEIESATMDCVAISCFTKLLILRLHDERKPKIALVKVPSLEHVLQVDARNH